MKQVEQLQEFNWHQLEAAYGGYISCHVIVSGKFDVLTTPISTEGQEVHRREMYRKISKLEADG